MFFFGLELLLVLNKNLYQRFEEKKLEDAEGASERLFISYLWGIKAEMEPIK